MGLRRFAGLAFLAGLELCVALAVVAGLAYPVMAQGWFGGFFNNAPQRRPYYQPYRQPQYQQPQQQQYQWQWWPQHQRSRRERDRGEQQPVDFSRAPPPRKQESVPTTHIAVLGDSMADWLAYGLEEAFAETPEIGIIRKNRANRGLILGTSKSEYDWAAVAREALAAEKPDYVIMMTGLADRQPIHVRAAQRPAASQKPAAPAAQKPEQNAKPEQGAKPEQPAAKSDAAADSQDPEAPPTAAAEPTGPVSASSYEFRTDKWAEAYAKRVDEVIAALKSRGVPVFWVGLPSVRGPKATADMVYLNDIYRGRAEKAGIIYVDIWDGFVDENGTYAQYGPDFEGQTRRLRSGDGIHFTKAGARKLAHFVEREIRRAMQTRGAPVAMPSPEEPQPQVPKPGVPVARPAAGPVVPLTAAPGGADTLMGGSGRSPGGDTLVNQVLVRGEPVQSLRGRADDFAWPRQEGPPVASTTKPPERAGAAANAAPGEANAALGEAPGASTTTAPAGATPAAPPKPKRKHPVARPPQQIAPSFFGAPGPPRPAAPVNNGRSAFWPYGR